MDQQALDLTRERMPGLAGLPVRPGNRNNDVTQQIRLDGRESSLPQGKGEYVRGPVDAAVASVERAHGAVTREKDAQFGVRKTGFP